MKYIITGSNGRQKPLSQATDIELGKLSFASTGKLRRVFYRMLAVRAEVLKRGMGHPQHITEDPYDIGTTALVLAFNDYNKDLDGEEE
jgi:hypothetical protein